MNSNFDASFEFTFRWIQTYNNVRVNKPFFLTDTKGDWTHKNLKHKVCRLTHHTLVVVLWSSTFHTSFSLQECNATHHFNTNDSVSAWVPLVTNTMPYYHFHSHAQPLPTLQLMQSWNPKRKISIQSQNRKNKLSL